LNALGVALTYAIVAAAVIPIGFAVFKTQYQFTDVVLASILGAAASLIPTTSGLAIGGVASLVITVGVLYWRMRHDLYPDIVLSVMVARLATVPVLLVLGHR
jgi:uncharacterized membrane protein